MKSCGRHHCGATCCSGDHLCTKICGRALKCGSHNCTVLCHRGPCPTCLEASFDPLICTCGRTELPPPIRCGTKPPQCPFPCIVQPACGHPRVAHGCHPLDEECPKCPYLVEKECMCGKRSVKNQPCFRAQAGTVSCGLSCGALMPCGFHRCPAPCHRHTAEKIKCLEKCGKPRKSCGHACQMKWYTRESTCLIAVILPLFAMNRLLVKQKSPFDATAVSTNKKLPVSPPQMNHPAVLRSSRAPICALARNAIGNSPRHSISIRQPPSMNQNI